MKKDYKFKDGKYEFSVNHARVAITKEHLIIDKKAPEGYEYVGFSKGDIFINTVLDEELEAEGYSREFMRRVQALRKKAGLEKKDKIELYVKTDREVSQMFKKHKKMIQERVGASKATISELKPTKSYKHHKRYKVREKSFEVFIQNN